LYSKNELKRMFLRVLYEIQYGGLTGCSNSVNGIISSWFKRYWDVGLSEAERKLLREGVKEMMSDGLVQRDEAQPTGDFVVLTDFGRDVVERQLDPDSHAKKYF